MMEDFRTAVSCHLAMDIIADGEIREAPQRARIARAREALESGLRVSCLEGTYYFVPSFTRKGKEYCVAVISGEWHCDCPDYMRRRKPCKHILAVLMAAQEQGK